MDEENIPSDGKTFDIFSEQLLSAKNKYTLKEFCNLLYQKFLTAEITDPFDLTQNNPTTNHQCAVFLMLFAYKLIFNGELSFDFLKYEDGYRKWPVSLLSCRNSYSKILDYCNNDFSQLHLNALVLESVAACINPIIEFENSIRTSRYTNFIGSGKIENDDNLIYFHTNNTEKHSSIIHFNEKYYNRPGILLTAEDLPTIRMQQSIFGNDNLLTLLDGKGNSLSLPIPFEFRHIIRILGRNFCFDERKPYQAFALFLMAHGFQKPDSTPLFKKPFQSLYLDHNIIGDQIIKLACNKCETILLDKQQCNMILSNQCKTLLSKYFNNPYYPFKFPLASNTFKEECIYVKNKWILIDENFLNDEEKLCQRIVIDWCSGLQHTEIYNKYVAKSSFKGKNAVAFAKKYLTDMVIKIKHRPEFRHLPNAPTKGSSKN